MELIIVTGMSGAGKSLAVRALEDIGFYCINNMPPMLLEKFVQLCEESTGGKHRSVAIAEALAAHVG